MPKENLLFQLDTKEFQYHKLNHTLRYFNPRFHTTKLIKNANKNSRNQIKNNKKLKGIDLEGLYEEINDLKKEILFKKLYRICLKLNTKISNNSSYNDELKTTLRQLALHKLTKTLNKTFKKHDNEYKHDFSEMDENAQENPFKQCQSWISEADVITNLEKNFNVVKLNDLDNIGKETNKIISKVYQDKSLKVAISEFEDGMDVFLNINRGMKKVERKDKQAPTYGDNDGTEYDSEISRKHAANHFEDDHQDMELSDFAYEQEQEEEYSGSEEIDKPNNAYNKNLPELEHGFIDQYDSDSEDEREMEKELKKEKPQKKNRKGQRERRLIWEKKYGRTANHIQKKISEETSSKLERQQKYEERVAKRLEKDQEYLERLHTRKQREKEFASKEFHPSWEAKRIQEEKLKKVKFSGKKISFD